MSGILNNNLADIRQQHRERREEAIQAREEHLHARREHRGRGDDGFYNHDIQGQHRGRHHHEEYEDSFTQGEGRGYAPPLGAPPSGVRGPSGFASQGGLDRGDFASDADIDRMVASGEFNPRQARQEYGYGEQRENAYGRFDAPSGPPPGQGYGEQRGDAYGRYDTPSGPPPGQGYGGRENQYGIGRYNAPSGPPSGERASSYARYDAPSGPPPGGVGHSGGPDRQNQYGSQEPQIRSQYDPPQGYSGQGKTQGNVPSGGFSVSRDEERQGYGGPPKACNEPPSRGETASYYNQQGQGDRYAHLANIAQEHGNEDPEVFSRATQGLHDRIQQTRLSNQDGDYKAHVDAHRKAYGEDDHGPMDADAIGAAAAMEAIKQTAAAAKSSNPIAPAGASASKVGNATGDSASKPGRAAQDAEQDGEEAETAARAGPTGGLQDKLMALAMSQAGKLFDKKNAGSSGANNAQDKAQAMQSAAVTAMQLFAKYKSSGALEPSDMQKVMGLAKNFF